MKKHITVVSAALLIVIIMLFVSCGAKDDPAADVIPPTGTPAAGIETAIPSLQTGFRRRHERLELTFNGYDGTSTGGANKIDVEALDGAGVNDSIYNRNRMIEQRYNAVIKETKVPSVENHSLKMSRAPLIANSDGQRPADKLMSTQGVLLMWNDMPGCNLDNPVERRRQQSFQNRRHAVRTVGISTSPYIKNILSTSTRICMEQSVGGHQSVLDGEWTYERYYGLMDQYLRDLDGNSVYDESDQYGLAGMPRYVSVLLTGAGVKYVDLNDGDPYFSVPRRKSHRYHAEDSRRLRENKVIFLNERQRHIYAVVLGQSGGVSCRHHVGHGKIPFL